MGERRGGDTSNGEQTNPDNYPDWRGRETRSIVAERAGFGSEFTFRQAKAVVKDGAPELVAAMDRGDVSISAAAALAKKPAEDQRNALAAGKVTAAAACGGTDSAIALSDLTPFLKVANRAAAMAARKKVWQNCQRIPARLWQDRRAKAALWQFCHRAPATQNNDAARAILPAASAKIGSGKIARPDPGYRYGGKLADLPARLSLVSAFRAIVVRGDREPPERMDKLGFFLMETMRIAMVGSEPLKAINHIFQIHLSVPRNIPSERHDRNARNIYPPLRGYMLLRYALRVGVPEGQDFVT